MKITNNSTAPQGVHTAAGVTYIAPNTTKDVELTEPGHKLASRLPFLKLDGVAPVAAAAAAAAPTASAQAPKKAADPELVSARADYKAKFGKGAGPRWTVAQIRDKLAAE